MEYETIIRPYIEQLTAEEASMLHRYGRTMGTKICYVLRHNPQKLQLDMQKKRCMGRCEAIDFPL